MSQAMLAAIRVERERHQRCLVDLDRVEAIVLTMGDEAREVPAALARSPPGETAPRASETPPAAPRRNPSSREIVRFVNEHPRCRRGEMQTALGGNVNALDKKLKRLLEQRLLVAEGTSPGRRYLAPTAQPASGGAVPRWPCAGRDDFLRLVREHAPVATKVLMERTGRDALDLFRWGRSLTCDGLVAYTGEGHAAIWEPAPEPDLAEQVLAAIAAASGKLDEYGIAHALSVEFELVATACAELLDRGDVELDVDRYLPVQR